MCGGLLFEFACEVVFALPTTLEDTIGLKFLQQVHNQLKVDGADMKHSTIFESNKNAIVDFHKRVVSFGQQQIRLFIMFGFGFLLTARRELVGRFGLGTVRLFRSLSSIPAYDLLLQITCSSAAHLPQSGGFVLVASLHYFAPQPPGRYMQEEVGLQGVQCSLSFQFVSKALCKHIWITFTTAFFYLKRDLIL